MANIKDELQKRILIIDGAENASWIEPAGSRFLTQIIDPAATANSALRRIWAIRTGQSEYHPLLPPAPVGATILSMPPLSFEKSDQFFAAQAVAPDMHIHAFSPLEVLHGARTLGLSVDDYVLRLRDAGLDTLPGTDGRRHSLASARGPNMRVSCQ